MRDRRPTLTVACALWPPSPLRHDEDAAAVLPLLFKVRVTRWGEGYGGAGYGVRVWGWVMRFRKV